MIAELAAVLPPNLAGYAPRLAIGAGRGQLCASAIVRDRASFAAVAGPFGRRYPGADERAILSFWTQHYFAALIVPALAAAARLRRVLPLALDTIGCDLDEHGLPQRFWLAHGGVTRTSGALQESLAGLVSGHLRPFIHGCAHWSGLSRRVLWCNAGTMLDFAAVELGAGSAPGWVRDGDDGPTPSPASTDDVLQTTGADTLFLHPFRPGPPGAEGVRRVCCLRLRLPGGGLLRRAMSAQARVTRHASRPAASC